MKQKKRFVLIITIEILYIKCVQILIQLMFLKGLESFPSFIDIRRNVTEIFLI